MAKATHKHVKFSPEEMAYELPKEIDVTGLRPIGRGIEAVRKLSDRSKCLVGLDPDVARVFKSADQVNKVLRAIIATVPSLEKSRKKIA